MSLSLGSEISSKKFPPSDMLVRVVLILRLWLVVNVLPSKVGCIWNAERDVITCRHNEIVIDGAIVDATINPCNATVVEICGGTSALAIAIISITASIACACLRFRLRVACVVLLDSLYTNPIKILTSRFPPKILSFVVSVSDTTTLARRRERALNLATS